LAVTSKALAPPSVAVASREVVFDSSLVRGVVS
jgi:hypothetical protein